MIYIIFAFLQPVFNTPAVFDAYLGEKVVYIASGNGISMYDIEDDSLKDNIITNGLLTCIAGSKDYIVAGDRGEGVNLYRINKDFSLSFLTIDRTVQFAEKLAMENNIVAVYMKGFIVIYEITNDSLARKSFIDVKGNVASLIVKDSEVLFSRGSILYRIDGNVPVKWLTFPITIKRVINYGNNLFILTEEGKVYRNKEFLVEDREIIDIVAEQNSLYALTYKGRINKINTKKKKPIKKVLSFNNRIRKPHQLFFSNNFFMIISGRNELFLISPKKGLISHLKLKKRVYDVVLAGGLNFSSLGSEGLRINYFPSGEFLEDLQLGRSVYDMLKFGQELFTVDNRSVVEGYSLTEIPAVEKKHICYVREPKRIKYSNDLFFTTYERGVHILWICPCGPLKLKSSVKTSTSVNDVSEIKKKLYIFTDKECIIADISDAQNPMILDTIQIIANVSTSYNENLITASLDEGLSFYAVKNPLTPELKGNFPLPAKPTDLFLLNDTAYVALGEFGVYSFDVSDPEHIQYIKTYDTPGFATSVYVSDVGISIADLYDLVFIKGR